MVMTREINAGDTLLDPGALERLCYQVYTAVQSIVYRLRYVYNIFKTHLE